MNRYEQHVRGIANSTVFRRILQPVATLTALAAALCAWNAALPARALSLSLVPHTLLGAVLSLLLVFR